MSEVHSNILPIHRMSERTICLRLTMLQCSKCTFAIEMYIFNFFFHLLFQVSTNLKYVPICIFREYVFCFLLLSLWIAIIIIVLLSCFKFQYKKRKLTFLVFFLLLHECQYVMYTHCDNKVKLKYYKKEKY